MNKIKTCASALGMVMALTLVGCATQPDYLDPGNATRPYRPGDNSSYPPPAQQAVLSGYGVVKGIEMVRQDGSRTNVGVGTVAGAIIGGVIGHQIGGGTGNTVATVAGAAGGAYAGSRIAGRGQDYDAYRVTILMDGGTYQTLILNANPGLRLEDRVVVDGGVVRRY